MFTHPELELMITKLDMAIHTNKSLVDEEVFKGSEATLAVTQNEIMEGIVARLKDMRLNTVSIDADQMGHLYTQLQNYLQDLGAEHEIDDSWHEIKEYVDKVVLATSLMSKLAQGVLSEDDLQAIGRLLGEIEVDTEE